MTEHTHNEDPLTDQRKPSMLKIASYAGFAVGAIVLVGILALLFYPDPLLNRFIKPGITKAFAEAYPAYSIHIANMNYSVLKNRFGFDSVAVNAVDGKFLCGIGSFSVSGIDWMHLLWGGSLGPEDFADVDLDTQGIELNFPQSHYELRCKRMRVSAPDSEMVAESLELYPLAGDERFFEESEFRRTRFRLVTPQFKMMGLTFLELLQGKMYRTRSAHIRDAFIDVLINKDKHAARDTSSPPMPNEILSSIKGILQVDSLIIVNGQLKYGERFAIGSESAWITIDSLQVLAKEITNQGGHAAALVIQAQGSVMKAGRMNVLMSIPVASPEFSFQYSGSLGGMDLRAFNSFLETAEQVRIKGGVLQAATFEVNVVSGHASGNVRAEYKDLTLAAINKRSGSEKGAFDVIASFVANNMKIRTNNMPGNSGAMKIGKVKYTRQRDDPFIRFAWFALRTGVRDVAGF